MTTWKSKHLLRNRLSQWFLTGYLLKSSKVLLQGECTKHGSEDGQPMKTRSHHTWWRMHVTIVRDDAYRVSWKEASSHLLRPSFHPSLVLKYNRIGHIVADIPDMDLEDKTVRRKHDRMVLDHHHRCHHGIQASSSSSHATDSRRRHHAGSHSSWKRRRSMLMMILHAVERFCRDVKIKLIVSRLLQTRLILIGITASAFDPVHYGPLCLTDDHFVWW